MEDNAPTHIMIEANGLAFPSIVAGPSSASEGPLVLCLHGFPDTRHGFFPTHGASFGVALAAAGFRIVAPAMRGTDPACVPRDGDYSPAALASDVLALIDALGGKAVVVGNDWGALATYLAAAADPARVTHAVTLGIPHPRAVSWTPALLWRARHMVAFQLQRRAANTLRANDFERVAELYRRWSPTWQLPRDVLDEVKAAYRKPGIVEAALGPYAAFRQHFSAMNRALEGAIRVPTLALFGGSDPSVPAATYARAQRHFGSDYRWQTVPGVGHFVHREDPAGVAARVIAFLQSA